MNESMKLSDYVASFLSQQGIRHVFVVSGGASVHMIQSIADTPGLTFICPQHEQAGAMAADAYSRVSGNLGAAVATSGPGATNLLTGVACSFYDSVPAIFITGQVSTFRSRGDTGVRQIGFQETDTVDIFRPVTKYVVCVDDPKMIRYELEKACHLAKAGRPGPVLIDIPDNIQREQIDPGRLPSFSPAEGNYRRSVSERDISYVLALIENARRPVLIIGWGIRLAKAENDLAALINKTGIPFAPTWAAADIFPSAHSQNTGTFGTHGTRYGNFAVQNADLVISLGSRLDTKATGSPINTFAREAKKVIVDIDDSELAKFQKFGLNMDAVIQADVGDFLRHLNFSVDESKLPNTEEWLSRIHLWKQEYPICRPEYFSEENANPYVFVKTLAEQSSTGDVFVVDTGCALAWMMQGFFFKAEQRLYHDWNNTAMGWALPASIAASLALDRKPVTCVTGDGSLLMNIQELATIIRHQLPVKVFLLNNHGHSMIRQTQDQWLGSRYLASSEEGGLASPDFTKIAEAFGFTTLTLSRNTDLISGIRQVLDHEGPFFCNIEINSDHRVTPQVKFGRPNEDSEPLLPRDEFKANMLVPPLEVSLREV